MSLGVWMVPLPDCLLCLTLATRQQQPRYKAVIERSVFSVRSGIVLLANAETGRQDKYLTGLNDTDRHVHFLTSVSDNF